MMDTENPSPTPSPEPVEASPRRRSSILGGALLGAVALTASVVGVSAIAGAQDDPDVDQPESVEAVELEEMSEEDLDGAEIIELDEGDLDEMEFDDMGDFDEAAWQPYEECIDTQLGDLESTLFGDIEEGDEGEAVEAEELDESSISDEDFEAFEQAWMAADEACFDLLPEDAKAEAEAFKAFDQCLTDAGFSEDMGAVVYVEDGESGQSIQFGENAGTVTITGDSNGVSVATDGDVSVIDDEALEAAFEGCEELLPEDVYELDEFDMDLDEGELGTDEDGDDEDGEEDEGTDDEDGDDDA